MASGAAAGHVGGAMPVGMRTSTIAPGASITPTLARSTNAADPRRLTPVMAAVLAGQLDTAVQLALNGADLSARDAQGHTALELAVLAGNREVRNLRTPFALHTSVP
jgi:ankyrin repeat protein